MKNSFVKELRSAEGQVSIYKANPLDVVLASCASSVFFRMYPVVHKSVLCMCLCAVSAVTSQIRHNPGKTQCSSQKKIRPLAGNHQTKIGPATGPRASKLFTESGRFVGPIVQTEKHRSLGQPSCQEGEVVPIAAAAARGIAAAAAVVVAAAAAVVEDGMCGGLAGLCGGGAPGCWSGVADGAWLAPLHHKWRACTGWRC